ncbi:hypothetical protein [Streptomyces sp. BR123]|uniref:hypothetical protein n=1 Tax=Streptomyces sp. BR123 TaxID=2749828 RepID=UPI0015C4D882|nr:hypothetical protein [Streptomyces sp. BR123]
MRARTAAAQIRALERLLTSLTRVLVFICTVALVFTATNVTTFAIDHHVSPWIAWLLDPMVAVALGTVLLFDGRLSEYGLRPSGWASVLRWFAGLATWVMNCWGSLWPEGTPFGVPHSVDPAGLVLHSIPPVLLIALAEAISHYRRAILNKIEDLRAALVETGGAKVDPLLVHPAPVAVSTGPAADAAAPVRTGGRLGLSLVICGGQRVYPLTVPHTSTVVPLHPEPVAKLPAEDAKRIIRACWENGESIGKAALKSTRSTSYVHKVYTQLATTSSPPEGEAQ